MAHSARLSESKLCEVMQREDGSGTHALQAVSGPDVVAQKQDLVRQLATNPQEGGILAQLTSNPFFTAVWSFQSREGTS